MYNGSAQSVGKMRGSTPRFATTIFRYSSPARDGYATVLELLGSAGRRERAGIFSHNQSVASQIFLRIICLYLR